MRKIAENYRLPYYTMSPTYSICKDHGYITGEVWKCPICSAETEVYSRITGYYRPVKNWNPGKLQEFTDRKTYRSAKPDEVKTTGCDGPDARTANITKAKAAAGADRTLYLFTTRTCPKCAMIKKILSEKNIDYVLIDAEEEPELVTRFDIHQAPTLAVVYADGNTDTYTNVSEIIRYFT